MKRVFPVAMLAALLVPMIQAQYPGSVPPPAPLKRGFDSITISDAKEFLGYLAGPECAGRGTGQPGYQKAADYVAAHFKKWGLKPVGDNGTYFQAVPFFSSSFVDAGSSLSGAGVTIPAGANGFRLNGIREDLTAEGNVVVIRPAGDRLDLEGKNIEGAIVLVIADKPSFFVRQAINQGRPAAVLYVAGKVPDIEPAVSRAAQTNRRPGVPSGTIHSKVANELMEACNLVKADGSNPEVAISPRKVKLVAKGESKSIGVPNVVGLIEGTDPTLKAEIIGIGSHLDHEGVKNGVVYPGADDDGSGSTAIMQIAKAISQSPVKPKRSILFMAFAAEEMGLIGSAYYADNPIFPHSKMIAELQMDMVGRDSDGVQNGDRNRVDKASENFDTMRLVGSKRISTELDSIIQAQNKHTNFRFKYDAEDVYTRSDHYNFAKHGIPVAFLFDGFHPDYHQPTDTVDKINWLKLTTAAKLYYLTAMELANRPLPPKKDVGQAGSGN